MAIRICVANLKGGVGKSVLTQNLAATLHAAKRRVLVVDTDTQQILGCTILGIEGGEIMSMLQIAMMGKLPYPVLREAIFEKRYALIGFTAFLLLIPLAITSTRGWMKRLGKRWKRLHQLVYLASSAVTVHAILATDVSKKIFVRDPQAIPQLKVYLAVLFVLLVVRIPLIKRRLVRLRPQRQVERPMIPRSIPDPMPEYRPQVYEREVSISIGTENNIRL